MVAIFDPLSPSSATTSSHPDTSTFHTLTRERAFRHPPTTSSDIPALDEIVSPHIESFNALIEGEVEKGLLQLGVEDIGEKVVFDGKEREGRPWGDKITCESVFWLQGVARIPHSGEGGFEEEVRKEDEVND